MAGSRTYNGRPEGRPFDAARGEYLSRFPEGAMSPTEEPRVRATPDPHQQAETIRAKFDRVRRQVMSTQEAEAFCEDVEALLAVVASFTTANEENAKLTEVAEAAWDEARRLASDKNLAAGSVFQAVCKARDASLGLTPDSSLLWGKLNAARVKAEKERDELADLNQQHIDQANAAEAARVKAEDELEEVRASLIDQVRLRDEFMDARVKAETECAKWERAVQSWRENYQANDSAKNDALHTAFVAEERCRELAAGLERARIDVGRVNADGFDSTRRELAMAAIGRIDAVLAAAAGSTTAEPAACPECDGRGEVAATPGVPEDGPMPCPVCAAGSSAALACGHPWSDETTADGYTFCAVCAVAGSSAEPREPAYDEEAGRFICECGAPEAAFVQHEDDEHTLVCAACGVRYDTPTEGPWTFAVAEPHENETTQTDRQPEAVSDEVDQAGQENARGGFRRAAPPRAASLLREDAYHRFEDGHE